MTFKSRINKIRMAVMHGLTRNIGKQSSSLAAGNELPKIERILVSRPNSRLGNQVLVTPLIQELETRFPDCKIDLFVRGGAAPILFSNYSSVDRIISLPKKPFKELFKYLSVWLDLRKVHYDLVINTTNNSSSGRLSTRISRSKVKFYNDEVEQLAKQFNDYYHLAKFPVYNLRNFLIQSGFDIIINEPMPTLNLKLSDAEILNGKNIMNTIVSGDKPVIGIYTFATGAKCYSSEWWKKLYQYMISEFADTYDIMEVLPIENVSQIDFAAPAYYSRDVREMCAVMANTHIIVSGDCGVMHLASASQTSVVGLFSVTKADRYEPYGNGSTSVDTNKEDAQTIISTIKEILASR